ncbi:hypothetical protein IWQ61_000422 [Dispira simplex]|nr:hypothetical protein IWQ61_000422 [Dispira simplex]
MEGMPQPTTPTDTPPKSRWRYIWENLTWAEVSGGLGDLGTLIPILVSLSVTRQVSLTSSLFFGGLWNVITGFQFRIPMCVQPMKALAAVALSKPLTTHEILGAGIAVGVIVFVLGITRTIRLVARYTPYAIIKGIQLGTGVVLCVKATDLISKGNHWAGSGWRWYDNYELALVCFLFVFALYPYRKSPTALILFVVGLIIAIVRMFVLPPGDNGPTDGDGDNAHLPSPGFYYPRPDIPDWGSIVRGFLYAGLGQLPLTLLNSGIAVCALASDLFPEHPVPIEKVTMSVGVMNVLGCMFGSMPYCHGSGGLAGQYRFGARTEVSVYILGLSKMILGLVFGPSLLVILGRFPNSILGIMLFVSGIELALAARKYSRYLNDPSTPGIERQLTNDFLVMVVTAGLIVGFRNDAIGFLGGIAASILFWLHIHFDNKRKGITATTTSHPNVPHALESGSDQTVTIPPSFPSPLHPPIHVSNTTEQVPSLPITRDPSVDAIDRISPPTPTTQFFPSITQRFRK